MFREIAHFLRHLPGTARMRRSMSPTDFYDAVMTLADEAGAAEWRASLVADLEGDVLEIGCGTGLMFPHYKSGVRLMATEPDEDFLHRAEERAKSSEAEVLSRIPHLAQTSDAVNRQLSCFSSRYMNLLAVFQITCVPTLEAPDG